MEVTRAPWGMWPYDDGSFDVAVVRDLLPTLTSDDRSRCVSEVLRVLRPGGRALVIEPAPRGGFGALLSRTRPVDAELPTARSRRSRTEASPRCAPRGGDGVLYVEGIKKACLDGPTGSAQRHEDHEDYKLSWCLCAFVTFVVSRRPVQPQRAQVR